MKEERRDPLEDALRSFRPTMGLDRDRTMFLAGQAAAARPSRAAWLWPCATAASTLLSVGLAAALWVQSSRLPSDFAAQQPAPQPPETSVPTAAPQGNGDYLRLRNVLVRDGVTALPVAPADPSRDSQPTFINRPNALRELLAG